MANGVRDKCLITETDRAYLIEMFKSLFNQIENHGVDAELEVELEGWDRIERSIGEIRLRLADAETE